MRERGVLRPGAEGHHDWANLAGCYQGAGWAGTLSHPALLSRQTAPSLGLTEHGDPPPRSSKVSPYMGTSALPSLFHSLIVPLGMGWVY